MIITGVGSRDVPSDLLPHITSVLKKIGVAAGQHQWTLRSGAAPGMDSLFEQYWTGPKEIFIPWNGFQQRRDGIDGAKHVDDASGVLMVAGRLARSIHPNWAACSIAARSLHTRNVFQVLGECCIEPSNICVFYAPIDQHGEVTGGTRTAVELSKVYNIPTYNLSSTTDVMNLMKVLDLE